MIYLLLTITVTRLLFVIFKLFEKFRINTFQAIVANYITCVLTGLVFNPEAKQGILNINVDWFPFSLFMGILFIGIFYLIGMTAQKVGVSAVSIASKISMVIPILFSLLILKSSHKEFNVLNYIGLGLSLIAVYYASKKDLIDTEKMKKSLIVLPITVFVFTGIADSIMNYTNSNYLTNETASWFTVSTFFYSSLFGILMILFRIIFLKSKLSFRSIVAGFILGIPNYFSIYFLLRALSAYNNDGAFMFPIMNIGVILFSIILSLIIFKEKLSRTNQIGIIISFLSILLISYQEIFNV